MNIYKVIYTRDGFRNEKYLEARSVAEVKRFALLVLKADTTIILKAYFQ